MIDKTTVAVNNSEISPINKSNKYRLTFITGQATQLEPKSFPNKLLVSFDFVEEMFSEKFRAATQRPVEANYNVMDTDYQNYAIVMNCRDFGFFTIEMGWILSRKQEFRGTKLFQTVQEKARKNFGFNIENAISTGQDPDNCEFDEVQYYSRE